MPTIPTAAERKIPPRVAPRILHALKLHPMSATELALMLSTNEDAVYKALRTLSQKRMVRPCGTTTHRGETHRGTRPYVWGLCDG